MKKYITGIFIVLLTALPAAALQFDTPELEKFCEDGLVSYECNGTELKGVAICTEGFNTGYTKENLQQAAQEYCAKRADSITVNPSSLNTSDLLEPATLSLSGRDPKNVSSGKPVTYNPTEEEKAEAQKDLAKYEEKKEECEAKGKDVKQNFLGMWVCTDTDETIEARKKEKKQNKDLKNFWDDMDKLERAFLNRVKKLNKESSKTGGQK